MSDHRPDRPADAGDRNRAQRLQRRRIRTRGERWALPEDRTGRPHRASRTGRLR